MSLDRIDSKIIEIMEKDARISFREIARKLNVSPDTISNRFEKLRKKGVIVDTSVVLDPSKIGYSFIVRFGINVKPAYSTQVLEKVIKIPSIIIASKLVGHYDLIAISVIKNFQHVCKLRDTILEMPYVAKVELGMWIKTLKLCPQYFLI